MARKKKKRYHTGTYTSAKGGDCKYRSGWELAYIKWLDANPSVKSFRYEGVVIIYISNVRSGMHHRYFPDFLVEYVDGRQVLVEIKPARKVGQRINQKKLTAARQWCDEHGATLEIMTEIELKNLGII